MRLEVLPSNAERFRLSSFSPLDYRCSNRNRHFSSFFLAVLFEGWMSFNYRAGYATAEDAWDAFLKRRKKD